MADDARALHTSAQLKGQIDSGRAGDTSGGLDPAAAPLGSDSEAAGAPPTPGEIAQARAQERSTRSSATSNAAEPELAPDARMTASGPVAAGLAIGAAVAVVFAGLLWIAVG